MAQLESWWWWLIDLEWTSGKIAQQEWIEKLSDDSFFGKKRMIMMISTEADNDRHLI